MQSFAISALQNLPFSLLFLHLKAAQLGEQASYADLRFPIDECETAARKGNATRRRFNDIYQL